MDTTYNNALGTRKPILGYGWQCRPISLATGNDRLLVRKKWRNLAAEPRSAPGSFPSREPPGSLKVRATFFPGNESWYDRQATPFVVRLSETAFTLLELMVVVSIIAILMVLVVPAFTNLKSAGDVTSAAYTIKGVLDTARTYAKANNTYTWVGFLRKTSRTLNQRQVRPASGDL